MRISDWSSDVCSSDLLLIFVERIEQRIIAVARLLFDLMKRRLPSRPVGRRPIVTRAREQVFAIKLQPRVDIPGDAPGIARAAVGVDHRAELVLMQAFRLSAHPSARPDRVHLGYPTVADLSYSWSCDLSLSLEQL